MSEETFTLTRTPKEETAAGYSEQATIERIYQILPYIPPSEWEEWTINLIKAEDFLEPSVTKFFQQCGRHVRRLEIVRERFNGAVSAMRNNPQKVGGNTAALKRVREYLEKAKTAVPHDPKDTQGLTNLKEIADRAEGAMGYV